MTWLAIPAVAVFAWLYAWHVDNRLRRGGWFPFCCSTWVRLRTEQARNKEIADMR